MTVTPRGGARAVRLLCAARAGLCVLMISVGRGGVSFVALRGIILPIHVCKNKLHVAWECQYFMLYIMYVLLPKLKQSISERRVELAIIHVYICTCSSPNYYVHHSQTQKSKMA